MHKPVEMDSLVEEDAERHVADYTLVHDAGDDSSDRDKICDCAHAEVVPDPAGVVSNEVSSGVIKHSVLASQDSFFLVVGTDDAGSSHLFMEERVDWLVDRRSHFVKLIVGVKIWLRDFGSQSKHDDDKNPDWPFSDT